MYSKEKQLQCQGKNGGIKTGFALYEPNPDNQEPKILATKALRLEGFYFFILSLCLGGKKILP